MTRLSILLILVFSVCHAGISFRKESITASIVACDTLEIRGIYYFCNSDSLPASTTIYYPFPVDSTLVYPHYIEVVRLADRLPVSFLQKTEGITWKQKVPSRFTDSVRVVYRQRVRHRCGRYILTTTQYWKKPLERAEFTVISAAGITLDFWTFQADSVRMQNGRLVYHSHQKNFLPESDMLLEWSCDDSAKEQGIHK